MIGWHDTSGAFWRTYFKKAIAIMAIQVANPAAGTRAGTVTCGVLD